MRLGEEPLSLAVVDVDRFKSVNDAASHTQGDVVLRRVADLLREHSRTGDEVYRWAGDEFLVVLPTATEAQAVVVMERLRAAVAAADWSDLQLPEPVTVSHRRGHRARPSTRAQPATVVGWRALFDTADLQPVLRQAGRPQPRARTRCRARPTTSTTDDGDRTQRERAPPGTRGTRRTGDGAFPNTCSTAARTTCTVRSCHPELCIIG